MAYLLEYHKAVQRSFLASLAPVGMLSVSLLLLASLGIAQINGVSPSVTSPGFGGRAINGTPPSVTSLGRNGFAPPSAVGNFFPQASHTGGRRRHHIVDGGAYYPYVYAMPVPYAVDVVDSEEGDDDSNYQGGPTVFDRRGFGRDSYIPPTNPGPAHTHHPGPAEAMPSESDSSSQSAAEVAPESPQPATVLIFKDGHQLEVGNYAIVSQTLYDLTPGHRRKIAVADLDLSATQRQNDDRGVAFQLPPSAQAN